jgi:hypothetical protein
MNQLACQNYWQGLILLYFYFYQWILEVPMICIYEYNEKKDLLSPLWSDGVVGDIVEVEVDVEVEVVDPRSHLLSPLTHSLHSSLMVSQLW